MRNYSQMRVKVCPWRYNDFTHFHSPNFMELNNKLYIQQPFERNVWKQQLLFMDHGTNSVRGGKNLVTFLFSLRYFQQTVNKLSCSDVIIFSSNIVCVGYHRTTWIEAVCALCTNPSFSHSGSHTDTHTHTTQMHPDPTLLLSLVAWHKGDPSFPTHHLKREKIKKTQRAVSLFNGEKTHSVTAAILFEITVGTRGPCCLCIPLAFHHWWVECLHNECSTVGGLSMHCVYITYVYM